MDLLPAGHQAPEFEALDQAGRTVRLGDARGRTLALFFYPENDTPGCVAEACAFRDLSTEFEREGVVVWGVSVADVDSHARFAKAHGLPFRLIADADGHIAGAFGALGDGGYARRVTFLVGPDGRIDRVFAKVAPATHATEVLEAARDARAERPAMRR